MVKNDLKNYAIILASGSGARFGSNIPKQFEKIGEKTIFEHCVNVFEKNQHIDSIILVITPGYEEYVKNILKMNNYKKINKILTGGVTRKESSSIGVNSIDEVEANVIIHDCARPFLPQEVLNNCIEALEKHVAVDVAIPVTDTVLIVENDEIQSIPNRNALYNSQTPQCFRLSLIKKAHDLARYDENFTDDCGLLVKYNLAKIFVVQGSRQNIKITYPDDVYLANNIYNGKK